MIKVITDSDNQIDVHFIRFQINILKYLYKKNIGFSY